MKTEPLDDCAVIVHYDRKTDTFKLERLRSLGRHSESVDFYGNGQMDVRFRKHEPGYRFSISFILPPGDTSGGFSGIKIWPVKEKEPKAHHVAAAFHVELTPSADDPAKITKLTLIDDASIADKYKYRLGIYKDKRKQGIAYHDPQIYNTGDLGGGGEGGKG